MYNGQVVSDPQAKAEVLIEQYQYVLKFTWEVTSFLNIPNKDTSPFPAMPKIIVSLKGVENYSPTSIHIKLVDQMPSQQGYSRNLLWWWH